MITREFANAKLEGFKNYYSSESDQNGILLWIPEEKQFFTVAVGTGDNLLDEDIEAGYDSYLWIQTFTYEDPDMEEEDGGDMMYVSSEQTYDEDICTAVYDALEFHYGSAIDFVPLQFFVH